MTRPRPKPILIAGPTASGKSALALQLARDRGGHIIAKHRDGKLYRLSSGRTDVTGITLAELAR